METPLSRSAFVRVTGGGALVGYLALAGRRVSAQSSVEERANAALKEDDTAKAVEIWASEYKKWPFDDKVGASFHRVLMIHANRSLDKGALPQAKAAVARANELFPDSSDSYLDEAIAAYKATLFHDDMQSISSFNAEIKDGVESRYVELPGLFGGTENAFQMTEEERGYVWTYSIADVDGTAARMAAIRMLVNAMNDDGYVTIEFGRQEDGDRISFKIFAGYTKWSLQERRNGEWLDVIASGEESFFTWQWHRLELRVRNRSIEVWLDTRQIAAFMVPEYTPGLFAVGVGRNSDATTEPFTAVFDDIAVYSLK